MNDNVFAAVLTGTSPYAPDAFTEAVAKRFELIKGGEAFAELDSSPHASHGTGYCYDGNRCRPENIGWRAAQTAGFHMSPEQVEAGEYDDQIAEGFHAAASSEFYYRFEKDWG
ncbi:hypothetical protein LCGC14_1027320 [marine sediment metagenome]|uniref:Uncharacterized protein n=1 Tax=marine sediment metagenome TaxID=412755 RepID=A0A0F9MVN8_9ZZZZ